MRKPIIVLALLALTLGGNAFAQTVDDILLLAQKNVGEDVMLAFVEASSSAIKLSSADIIKLKDAKVPDKVIVAMQRHHSAASPASQPQLAKENKPAQTVKRTGESNLSGDNPVVIDRRPETEVVREREQSTAAPAANVGYTGYPSFFYTGYQPAIYNGYYYPGYVWPNLYFGYGGWYGGGYYGGFHGGFGGHGRR